MNDTPQTFRVVVDADSGLRLDRWLADHWPGRARHQIQLDIEAARVTVNGEVRPARYKVRDGDVIAASVPLEADTALRPQSIPLRIVYEDEHVIVIDKPAGMVVHPAPGHEDGTLANALLAHCGPSLQGVGGEGRWGIVHRLDALTSGLICTARTSPAYEALVEALAARRVRRLYVGLVIGSFREASGTVDRPIGRRAGDRKKMGVVQTRRRGWSRPPEDTPGREARTDWRLLCQDHGLAFVGLALHTGRTHQIRVHMQSIGRPILADPEYGWTKSRTLQAVTQRMRPVLAGAWPGRQMLHAVRLEFDHPVPDGPGPPPRLAFTSQPPEDFTRLLDRLFDDSWQAPLRAWSAGEWLDEDPASDSQPQRPAADA